MPRKGENEKKLFSATLVFVFLAACAPAIPAHPIWLSSGPRGIQFTSDFELSEIFRDDQAYYYAFATGPEGKEIYAVRRLLGQSGSREAPQLEDAIVHMYGLQGERIQTDEFLRFDDLKDPGLWDPDVDLSGIILLAFGEGPSRGLLSIADNGDVFILATAGRSPDEVYAHADPQPPPQGTSLIVRHPDGSLQKVVTIRELVKADILESEALEQRPSFAMVASAPDGLWLKVVTWPQVQPRVIAARAQFYQIQDPNGDGDWSDRTVQPFSLLVSFTSGDPSTGEEPPWFGRQMVAEPSLGGEDRSGSFLLAVSNTTGEYRIYRVSDLNRDGDALDPGELEPLFIAPFTISPDAEPNLTLRRVVSNGRVVVQEMLVSSLTRPTRVSRITETGEVVDVARGFRFVDELVADFEGNVHIATQLPGTGEVNPTFLIYRLQTRPAGSLPEVEPTATALPVSGAMLPNAPRIAFLLEDYSVPGEDKGEAFVIGADDTGPVKLVVGEHIRGFCPSADGSLFGYWSDEEVPNETFLYVANADGSNLRKVTEEPVSAFWCNFSSESLPLVRNLGRTSILIRHNLENGEETTLLTGGDCLVISPVGQRFLFVSGLDMTKFPPAGEESLEILDIATGERLLLDGPLAEGAYSGLQWSADGKRVAYFVGPPTNHLEEPSPADRYDLYVREVSGGEDKLIYQLEGSQPSVYWSSSGKWLFALVAGTQLLQIDAETGDAQVVAREEGGITFFSWWHANLAPKGDSFAYATSQSIFLGTADGTVRVIATAEEGECLWCGMDSFGWSPDGRYIGLWDWFSKVAALDTTTGEIRVLVEAKEDEFIGSAGWWR